MRTRVIALAAGLAAAGLAAAVLPAAAASHGGRAATRPAAASHTARIDAPPPGTVRTFGAAHAMPSVHLPPTHLPHVRPASPASPANGTFVSNNWAGYGITSRGGHIIPQVNDTFIVPDINCADSTIGSFGAAYVADWAGFDGLVAASGTVEQEGVDAYCTSTSAPATYFDWYEMFPLDPVVEGTVSPGDAISVESARSGADYVLSLTDMTSASGFSTTQPCPSGSTCLDTSAEVITEDPGGAVPAGVDLADFAYDEQDAISAHDYAGAVGSFNTITNIWNSQTIDMVDPSDLFMAAPGGMAGGSSFLVHWYRGT